MSADATAFAWKYSPVTKSAFLVHLALADVANDMHKNELWCSTDKISRKTRVGRSVVVTALDRLVELGLLEVVKERPGRTTLYRFLYPDLPIQFSDDPREMAVQNPDAPLREPDATRPETGHELKGSLANQRDRVRKCEGWAEIAARSGQVGPTVSPCILKAGHDGECEAVKPLELVRERKDTA